jgi:hypothetical protein
MAPLAPWYLGVDWGSVQHHSCLQDATGHVVAECVVPHSHAGLATLIAWLRTHTQDALATVAAAIEVPTGPVVTALRDAGVDVAHINPKQLQRCRERATAAGVKDDRRDAWTLATARRTDAAAFHPVPRDDDPRYVALRELTRLERELLESREQLTQRLRTQLHATQPALLTLVPAADEPWLWTLLTLAPTPAAAARLRPSRIAALLRTHRIRRVEADTVLTALRTPPLPAAPGVVAAHATRLAYLLPQLALLDAQHRDCTRAITQALAALDTPSDDPAGPSDVAILLSCAGAGAKVVSTLLAEWGADLATTPLAALRAYAGVAPVTKASGKHRLVVMRYACNHALRNAMYWWAQRSITLDADARALYAGARARGHNHARALRSVADHWLRILVALLTTRTTYIPRPRLLLPDAAGAATA